MSKRKKMNEAPTEPEYKPIPFDLFTMDEDQILMLLVSRINERNLWWLIFDKKESK